MSSYLEHRFTLASLPLLAALAACGPASVANVAPSAAQDVQVAVSPASTQVAPGGKVTFSALVTGTADTSVTWIADAGTIDASGTYTAPTAAGTYQVTAQSKSKGNAYGKAKVTVSPTPTPTPTPAPVVVAVAVAPASTALDACSSVTLSATVTGTTNGAVTWSVAEGAAGGTITSAGVYTAPASAGTYHAVATSQADPSRAASATIVVTEKVLSVAISPAALTLQPGGTGQFTATVTTTCGTTSSTQTVTAPL